jgi:hypothetical protein
LNFEQRLEILTVTFINNEIQTETLPECIITMYIQKIGVEQEKHIMHTKARQVATPVIDDILSLVVRTESSDDFPEILGGVVVDIMLCDGEDSGGEVDLLRPTSGANATWGAMVRLKYEHVEKAEVSLNLTFEDSGLKCGLVMVSDQSYHPLESVKVGPDFLDWFESKLRCHIAVCLREQSPTLTSGHGLQG